MNIKRLVLAIVVGFVVIFGTDFLIHALWLHSDYDATKELWRPEAEMHARFHWMLIAQFLCAAVFVIIWAQGFAGRGMGAAVAFGLLMGTAMQIWVIINHVVSPVPGILAAKWFFSGLAQAVLLGLVTAAIYKPATPAAP
ncbi:MAG TPA: hypothetical protein VJS88_02850 [Chthoniobacterales bacterium]|nr:hypothetical protein [Chthoniobacterales bacterium]